MGILFNASVNTPCGKGVAKETVTINANGQIENNATPGDGLRRWRLVYHKAEDFSPVDTGGQHVVLIDGSKSKLCAYAPEVLK